MTSTETCTTTRYQLLCVCSIKLHCVLVHTITHNMMGVENQRPEDIKVAGRESSANCECRMLEHSILSGSLNVGGMYCYQT
jgi:hypothetical protein